MLDEGYIKFTIDAVEADPPVWDTQLEELNSARNRLYDLGLVGMTHEGIGFGNLSIRNSDNFIITASATGGKKRLEAVDYAFVVDFDLEKNWLRSKGAAKASSESMSHGALYQADDAINCVIHVHSRTMFDYMLEKDYAGTSEHAAYGTPEMALDLKARAVSLGKSSGIFVMTGHQDGVIAYGSDIKSALALIEDLHTLVIS